MPSFRHHELGDLYVKLNVKFPEHIDPSVIPQLEAALPTRKAIAKFGKKIHMDEVTLEEPNDRQRRSAQSGGDEMDEDDDDPRQGVQCAQRTSRVFSIIPADHHRINAVRIRPSYVFVDTPCIYRVTT
jgi:DnaJ family protein A protein 2